MTSEPFLKIDQRISFFRLHKEHVVCIQKQVDDQCKNAKAAQQRQARRDLAPIGADVPCGGENNGIERQLHMDGKAVNMAEIQEGKLGPRGEEQRRESGWNANGVEKII